MEEQGILPDKDYSAMEVFWEEEFSTSAYCAGVMRKFS
jgi:hypothetical protein